MLKGPKLKSGQWKLLASTATNISQAIILFSLAAFFVPEAINLPSNFPHVISLIYLLSGFVMLAIGVTIVKKGKQK